MRIQRAIISKSHPFPLRAAKVQRENGKEFTGFGDGSSQVPARKLLSNGLTEEQSKKENH